MDVHIKYKPHKGQKLIHKYCEDNDTKYIVAVCGRQAGKTFASMMQLIKWAFKRRGQVIWVISPSSSQATKYYKSILTPLQNAGLVKHATASKGDIKIELINNTLIEFKSALAGDTLRGQTLDYIIIDEGAFIDGEIIDEVILPMIVTKKNAKVLVTTTPKGKSNWVYKWFQRGNVEEGNYKSIRFTSAENPLADETLIEGWKETMPAKRFRQEILAEFIDAATVFENVSDLVHNPTGGTKNYAGIDIGMVTDNTVITIMNQKNEIQHIEKFTNIPVQEIVDRIITTLNKYNVSMTYLEGNNQGLPIFQLLQPKLHNKIKLFYTTATSKPLIINNLIASFSLKDIKIIDDEELKNELESFEEKYGPTGKVTFSAPSGLHDDHVMSLAITLECVNKERHVGVVPIEF